MHRVDPTAYGRATSQLNQAPKPQRPAKAVQLHRLDGTPYEIPRVPLRASVINNSSAEQQPPKYQSKASYANLQQPESLAIMSNEALCEACGRKKSASPSDPYVSGARSRCARCGRRSTTNVYLTQQSAATEHTSPSSDVSMAKADNRGIGSDAVHELAGSSGRSCNKCGRMKKPNRLPAATGSAFGDLSIVVPLPAHHVANQHRTFGAGLRMPSPQVPRRKPVLTQINPSSDPEVLIDVVPPTAVSERPGPNELSTPNADESPLLQINATVTKPKARRSSSVSSIASSITRSVSKRLKQRKDSYGEKTVDHQPSQTSDTGANRLISMITYALRRNDGSDYSRLDDRNESSARPTSPFSFVGKRGDDIELGDFKETKPAKEGSWNQVQLLTPDSELNERDPFADRSYLQIPEPLMATGKEILENSNEVPKLSENDFLVQPGRLTDLTRFKSLRTGVQRAGSIARSASLKRLGSLKAAPQFWYRTDMAIEGATVGVY